MSEVEERISRISNLHGVKTLLIVDESGKVLRTTQRKEDTNIKTAIEIGNIISELAHKAKSVVRDLDPLNTMTFFRVRARKREILVAPDKHLFLIVIQEIDTDQQ